MSGIGGPGGIGGPKGPTEIDGAQDVGDVAAADIETVSADLAAGKLSPQEAVDRLVEATMTPDMDAAERAELRELLTDLVANDPYLGGLTGRLQ